MRDSPIYLDAMSTAPLDPRVREVMLQYLDTESHFGNAASRTHAYGWDADRAVEYARQQVADAIGAPAQSVVWTSGATESNNLAIKGAADFYSRKGQHFIATEDAHKAVLDPLAFLSSRKSDVTLLPVEQDGRLDLARLEAAIRPDTVLVSVLAVNNETGVIQDVAAIAECVHKKGALLHVDAAQAVGKMDFCVDNLDADLVSFSAHKACGPKGAGALYVRQQPRRIRLTPLIHGGGHELGLRSGTLPTHQVVGMGMAFELAHNEWREEAARVGQLRDRLWEELRKLPDVMRNGSDKFVVPHCLNVSFLGLRADTLLARLSGIAASSGSACNSASAEPSHVLKAMGFELERTISAVRFSFSRFNTEKDVDHALLQIPEAVTQLKQLIP